MEFPQKLQALRKQRGLTQEELAAALYVSRTAVSKWESGRGYPGIDSLKAISAFFSVSLDTLLSSDELVTVAQKEQAQRSARYRGLAAGSLDLCMSLHLFLPFFAERTEDPVAPVSLLRLNGAHVSLKIAFLAAVLTMTLWGAASLILRAVPTRLTMRYQHLVSCALSAASILLFTLCLHPYAAVYTAALLLCKVLLTYKKP